MCSDHYVNVSEVLEDEPKKERRAKTHHHYHTLRTLPSTGQMKTNSSPRKGVVPLYDPREARTKGKRKGKRGELIQNDIAGAPLRDDMRGHT